MPASITNEQFERVRLLSFTLTGIELADRHRELLTSRCRRLKLDTPGAVDSLLLAAEGGLPEARQRLISLITTGFTTFFRNPAQFDIAAQHALMAIQQRGTARLWSAAAATGEEPYSLAMTLIDSARDDNPPAKILATDINRQALEFARRGEYRETALRFLEPRHRSRFFSCSKDSTLWCISEATKRLIDFQELNLTSPEWPVAGPFDVIFCRNVLLYLEFRQRQATLARLTSLIAPDGLLILDPVEHLGEAQREFSSGKAGVYQRKRSHGRCETIPAPLSAEKVFTP